jgi:hypothetical protein
MHRSSRIPQSSIRATPASPKDGKRGDEGMLDQIMRIIIIRIMEDASSWVP